MPLNSSGFLSFNSLPPRLHVTADGNEFDESILRAWKEEDYDVTYLPFLGNEREYVTALQTLADDLELGESYAIIAFGKAARICLEVHTKPMPHLATLVCYYPDYIPYPSAKYPTQLQLLVHLSQSQGFSPAFHCYAYDGPVGFAEPHSENYDPVSEGLAWSRSLGLVRKGFKREADLETVRDRQLALEFTAKDPKATVAAMADEPHVNYVPTLTGGIGQRELYRFYRDFFIPCNPPSMDIQLVSRTIGVNRVVDEMVITFRHTQEVPWMLPGVPPTNKTVEIGLVSIVCIHAGKLKHEHIYWDQASVLVQIGLLDPQLVPESMKKKGMKRLPVSGSEAAEKILDPEYGAKSNRLIPNWEAAERRRSKS